MKRTEEVTGTKDWHKNKDKTTHPYRTYYKNVLKPGEKSKSLFTRVSIADDADDIVLEGFDIYVYAESVQSESGKSSEEMWDYFENK